MYLLTQKREIKRAHVHRAYENTTFCMFIIRNNYQFRTNFQYLQTCKHCITHWQGIISGSKQLFDTDSESRGIHVLKTD